jgi:hypothetical protein
MTRPVLFVCSNQTHVRMFTPVARFLTAETSEVSETSEVLAIRWVALDRYYRHEAERALREDRWAEYTLLPRPEGALGTPWEGGPLARLRVFRQGRKAVHEFLRDAPPGIVVLGNDIGTLERLFIRNARELGIPSLLVQEGVFALHDDAVPQFSAPRRLIQRAMTCLGLRMADPGPCGLNGADHVAVMGDAVARWLTGRGLPTERIVVTGQPRYDALYALRHATAPAQGLASQRIILFSSQPYVRYNMCSETAARQIWQTVIQGVGGLGDEHHLVAKLHPAEDLEWTRRWLTGILPPEWTLTRDEDVLSLTARADAVVTVISTTALEALCLGKPVVLLDACGAVQPIPYVTSGATLQARDAAQLTVRLREALYDDAVRQRLAQAREPFVREHLHILDGKAAERVAVAILQRLGQT